MASAAWETGNNTRLSLCVSLYTLLQIEFTFTANKSDCSECISWHLVDGEVVKETWLLLCHRFHCALDLVSSDRWSLRRVIIVVEWKAIHLLESLRFRFDRLAFIELVDTRTRCRWCVNVEPALNAGRCLVWEVWIYEILGETPVRFQAGYREDGWNSCLTVTSSHLPSLFRNLKINQLLSFTEMCRMERVIVDTS